MPKRMEIRGYLIRSLESQIGPVRAMQELVDNSARQKNAATRIDICITSGSMTITDNGNGCDDPNVMATPSASRSRHDADDIGVMGIGAKQAMATFGRTWDIHTVPKNAAGRPTIYHHYKVEWNVDGDLPDAYEGTGKPSREAPQEIRKGGTKIIVTQRQTGIAIRPDKICLELEKTYRPALNNGLAITVKNPESNFSRGLANAGLDASKFNGPLSDLVGTAAGRSFKIRFGVLKEANDVLGGAHFIFGERVLLTLDTIGKVGSVPTLCFIDVILGSAWKNCLSTNKTRIVRHWPELNQAVGELLQAWIVQQRNEALTTRLRIVAGRAAVRINDSILFLNKEIEGEYGPKPREKRERPDGPRPAPTPRPPPSLNPVPRRTLAEPGRGLFDAVADTKPRKCMSIEIEPDPNLGFDLYKVSVSPSIAVATVKINIGPNQSGARLLFEQEKIVDLERVVVMAYASMVAASPTDHLPLFAALRKKGYDLDEDMEALKIQQRCANFFIDDLARQKKGRLALVVNQ